MGRFHLSLAQTPWKRPTSFPAPPMEDEVHVWRLKVSEAVSELGEARAILSQVEKDKADRYYFESDRNCSVLARAALRTIAGKYLGVSPDSIEIGTEGNGKPRLRQPKNNLACNLSHSAGWIVLAFGAGTELGVDIERVNTKVEVENIAANFFSRLEVPVILGQPREDRPAAFFYAWTRKEALIKATGEGLSLPLNAFGVSILAGEQLRVLHTDWSPSEADNWALVSFMAAADLPAAIARKGSIGKVSYFTTFLR